MKFFLVLLICLFQFGCKFYGTEGGNPGIVENGQQSTFGFFLAGDICSRRAVCNNQFDNMCLRGVLNQDKITSELKMNPPYVTLLELIEAEFNKKVTVSIDNYSKCAVSISKLDCSDPAFDPNTYDDIHRTLRATIECSEIYEILK